MEHDGAINAVQEFRPEEALDLIEHVVLHPLVVGLLPFGEITLMREAQRPVLPDQVGADIARHHDERVSEVDLAALGVGQVAVVEDLQEQIEHLRVGLFDLVQEDQAVRLAAHRLGELSALVVPDVTRRGAHQPRDRVALHELGHVDPDDRVLAAEHELGELPRQVGLAHPGRPGEDEDADGPLRVLQPGAGPAHGLGDQRYRLLLAHDALAEHLLHVDETLRLVGRQPA